MLEVEHEPDDYPLPYEHCCKCGMPTPYWYTKKDVALCRPCAEKYTERDIPSKNQWIASVT